MFWKTSAVWIMSQTCSQRQWQACQHEYPRKMWSRALMSVNKTLQQPAAQVLCLQSVVGGRQDGHAAVDVLQMLPQRLPSIWERRRNTKKKALFLLTVFLFTKPLNLWRFQKEIEKMLVWCCWVPPVLVLCFRVCGHPKGASVLCPVSGAPACH